MGGPINSYDTYKWLAKWTYEQLRTVTTLTKKRFGPFFSASNWRDCYFKSHTFSGGTFSKPHGFGLFFHAAISLQLAPTGSSAVDLTRTFVVLTVKDPESSRTFEKVEKVKKTLKQLKQVETT